MDDPSKQNGPVTLWYPGYDKSSLDIIWRFQIAWGQVSIFLSILGNVFVLYATIAHNAIKLDSMSIWIIKNLAVSDICNCLLVLMPMLVTQYGKLNQTLIFREIFYTTRGCYLYIFFTANLFLVNILSLNKLMRCMFPLRNLGSTRRQRITVTVFTVVFSSLPTAWIVYGILDGSQYISDGWRYINYLGVDEMHTPIMKYGVGHLKSFIGYAISFMFSAFPCITLIVLNSVLVMFTLKRSNRAINRLNLLVVVLVTAAFLISILPYFVSLVINTSLEYNEIVWSLCYISTWINPFIYLAVNPDFKKYTKKNLLSWKHSSSVPYKPSSHSVTRQSENMILAISKIL